MFDFRKIQLSDRERVNACLAVSDLRGCEYCFANNCAWQRLNDTVICFHNDFYICMAFSGGEPYFVFPSGVRKDAQGKEKLIKLFAELEKFVSAQGHKLVICSVLEEDLPWLKVVYGSRISVKHERSSSDYIYNAKDLIELSGKKYHGKRNHIRRFMENEWSFDIMNENDIDEAVLFTTEFYNRTGNSTGSNAIEQYAIHFFLMNMEQLGLTCGILRSSGRTVGITIGERLNSDTFVVHIEKALSEVNGAYPMLCNQLAKAGASQLSYINREEDMGIEGLRKSKLSYHPVFLLDKYTVCFD